jgi:hypothetical protein
MDVSVSCTGVGVVGRGEDVGGMDVSVGGTGVEVVGTGVDVGELQEDNRSRIVIKKRT